jgi:hypothetical protein
MGATVVSVQAATSSAQTMARQSVVVHCGFALTQSMSAAYWMIAASLAWVAHASMQAWSEQLLEEMQSASQVQP